MSMLFFLLALVSVCFASAVGNVCLLCNCVFVNITRIEPKPGDFVTFQYKADAIEPFNANTTYESLQKYFYVDCSSESNVGQINNLDWPNLQVLGILANFRSSKWKKFESFPETVKKQLTVLSLSNNLITGIEDYELDEFTELKMLNLSNNQVQIIRKGTFSKLSLLKIVDLSVNWLTKLEDWAFYGTDMQYLNLSKNAITHITTDVFRGLNNLTVLDLSENRLTKLPDEFGNSLPSLTWLSVRKNGFQKLPELPKNLKRFDVSHNQMTDLHLAHLNLEFLDITNNELLSLTHTNFPALKVLMAGHNNMSELSELQSSRIQILDLSYNKFDRIPDVATSDNLPLLTELYLDGNPIVNVTFPTQSEPFSELRVLSLSRLKYVKKIARNSFQSLVEMPEILDERIFYQVIIDAVIREMKRAFRKLSLSCINWGFLLLLIKHMYAENVKKVFPTVKYDCSKESGILLDLSYNSIKFIDEEAFKLISICWIDLSNNHLKSLSKSLLPWVQMSFVNLQDNPWQCDCNIQWMLDDFMTFMYKNNPRLLFGMRCSTPIRYKNKMFVFWYNRTDDVFCDSGPSSLYIDLGGNKKLEVWTASAITCVFLGCVVLLIGIIIIVLMCTRPSGKKKKQGQDTLKKGPPYYKQITNNANDENIRYSDKCV